LTPFYPPDFTTDPNGKRQSWEAVVQIPFIDADLLLDTVNQILEKDKVGEKPLLTKAERLRNSPGKEHLFIAPQDGPEEEEMNGDASGRMDRSKKRSVKGQTKSKAAGADGTPKKKTKSRAPAKKGASPKKEEGTPATVGKSEKD
jgi:5'-3' exonuclease